MTEIGLIGGRMRLFVPRDKDDPCEIQIFLTGEGNGASVRITTREDSLIVTSDDETKPLTAFSIKAKR